METDSPRRSVTPTSFSSSGLPGWSADAGAPICGLPHAAGPAVKQQDNVMKAAATAKFPEKCLKASRINLPVVRPRKAKEFNVGIPLFIRFHGDSSQE